MLREGLARHPDSAHLKLKLAWNDWRRAYSFWSADAKSMQADFASADPTLALREIEDLRRLGLPE